MSLAVVGFDEKKDKDVRQVLMSRILDVIKMSVKSFCTSFTPSPDLIKFMIALHS